MALTPAPNDAFIREVDDAVRQDNLASFGKRYGVLIGGLIVLGLLVFGGWLLWQNHSHGVADETGERYAKALAGAASGKVDDAAIAAIAKDSQGGYRAGALLIQAGAKSDKNDVKGAIADYKAIAADAALAQPYRDLATVRQTALEFDSLPPQTAIDRLKPLAEKGNAWFGSAGEMTAIAYMKLGKRDVAGALFAEIAKTEGVPRTIQTRAVQMASLLGVDAQIAPQPGDNKDNSADAQ
ncbi:MAG TPA: tetratricopeptide repeat protein [Sphingobium sp.]